MARKNIYTHSIDLQDISISNMERNLFAQHIVDLPYRGYEVEQCRNGLKIVVTKPGGKTVYGALKREDILVFIQNPVNNTLWQISHKQILEDIIQKLNENPQECKKLLWLLERTLNGEEPNDFIDEISELNFVSGEHPEVLIKAYKWIWGQEDVNYPNGDGRYMSWQPYKELLESL
ncbi:MAG: hypothetical protein E7096_02395 [Bacteroides sp.]|nr:hypothetical protein [Bacteroides sp.]